MPIPNQLAPADVAKLCLFFCRCCEIYCAEKHHADNYCVYMGDLSQSDIELSTNKNPPANKLNKKSNP